MAAAAAPELRRRFSDLRGVRWRVDLGVLPAEPSASADELRRAAADSRRRYASLRRRLLIDPHVPKEESRPSNLVVDNPLSQNPDSTWGRFFRSAELEKTVDQDLSRLYPEDGSYFQTPACQAILRRILLLWCLQHPQYGYRQGMHELLAPLLYVLQVDLDRLSQVRKLHEDYFNDDFDGMPFPESDMVFSYKFRKGVEKQDDSSESTSKASTLDELDPDTREIILLSDAYGAEGELGVVLSERFMEHDAYSMFDGLMDGAGGVVRMAEFFSPSNVGSSSSLPPVIEASSALYHLLSVVDPSLHSHFIELGVEPQYFALRWLRVLFGREFSLDDLLVVWDEVFACSNNMLLSNDEEYSFRILCSARGAFIAAMAVSMLLHLRSSLLATEIATSCLQRLLNFPRNADIKKLIDKARSLQAVATDANTSSSCLLSSRNSWEYDRGHSLTATTTPQKTPLHPLPESYWEEKWRVLHKDGTASKECGKSSSFSGAIRKSLGRRLGLSRTDSDPSPVDAMSRKNDARTSVRRRLLDALSDDEERSKELDGKLQQDEFPVFSIRKQSPAVNAQKPPQTEAADEKMTASASASVQVEPAMENITERISDSVAQEACSSGEYSPVFSAASAVNDHENDHENYSARSSVTSNSCVGENDRDENFPPESCSCSGDNKAAQDSEAVASEKQSEPDGSPERIAASTERKPLVNKLQWLWKFGRPSSGEGSAEKGGGEVSKQERPCDQSCSLASDASSGNSRGGIKVPAGDKKVMGTLKNLGQNMLENIQVVESAFQQDRGQPGSTENSSNNILGGKGQVAAVAALKELRQISNLLCEM